jgi:hypothetical protein
VEGGRYKVIEAQIAAAPTSVKTARAQVFPMDERVQYLAMGQTSGCYQFFYEKCFGARVFDLVRANINENLT